MPSIRESGRSSASGPLRATIGPTEVACVRSMVKCLSEISGGRVREIGEGRGPK
jgi:hypothetical protein